MLGAKKLVKSLSAAVMRVIRRAPVGPVSLLDDPCCLAVLV